MSLNWIDPKIPNIRLAELISEPDYSYDVHYGRTREDGSSMPARPFIDSAIGQVDLEKSIAEEYQVSNDIADAFDVTAILLHGKIVEQIESPKWEWDRVTHRQEGYAVFSPRDIVDTGTLRDGQCLHIDGEKII